MRSLQPTDITITPSYPDKNLTCLLPFAHPTVRALIHEAKFYYNQRAHTILGTVVAEYLTTHYPDAYLVPIPLHPARERQRGFNQVTAVLKTQSTLRPALKPTLLRRTRNTTPQTKLNAEDRLNNLNNAFAVRRSVAKHLSSTRPILIIDDVHTTGATLAAAQSALRAALPHHTIYYLTFAYA